LNKGLPLTALNELEKYIISDLNGSPLRADVVGSYRNGDRFKHGWEICIDFEDGSSQLLRILVAESFPFSPPVLAFPDASRFLVWPHVEEDGRLCLFTQATSISASNPVGVLECQLKHFVRYYQAAKSGKLRDDFIDEFLSYWAWGVAQSELEIVSLLDVQEPSRKIFAHVDAARIVCADTKDHIVGWCLRYQNKRIDPSKLVVGVLLEVNTPPTPPYPRSTGEFWNYIRDASPAAIQLLKTVAEEDWRIFPIVLKFTTQSGVGLVGIQLLQRLKSNTYNRRDQRAIPGFRPGKAPASIIVERLLAPSHVVEPLRVIRADHGWIHGRDQDSVARGLSNARVALVGCGSLGSGVARLLAKSGLGHMLLVDDDLLDWPNISRHELGARGIRKSKSEFLSQEIQENYPHLEGVSYHKSKLIHPSSEIVKSILGCDLIVNASADWQCDQFLAHLQSTVEGFPPVIYSWLEPEALAAHAVLIKSRFDSILDGFDPVGRMHIPILNDQSNGEKELPGCAGTFSSYGSVALGRAQSMVAEAAIMALHDRFRKSLHLVSLERMKNLKERRASPNPEWVERHGQYPEAGGILELDWRKSHRRTT
jgi:hypothetical protein